MKYQQNLYMGTSGLVLPYKNSAAYPPEFEGQSRLQVYGSIFNSIEVNSIFYKLPRAATIAQWRESVNDDFRFTFKLWKQITHSTGLNFAAEDVAAFVRVINAAQPRIGCILVQFPPSVKRPSFERVSLLFSILQEETGGKWPVAVEFRNTSWYEEGTYALLDKFKFAMVYHDKASSPSSQPELAANVIYLRFHGPGGNYKGSYDEGLLYEYAGYISQWLSTGKTVYVYFNNTMGEALHNLQTLGKFLNSDFNLD
ncbi:Uncharacterized conserved protein YecE, DUF72 family [Dyadobacter sp. SG02]|uniref:DUF72 domain-containing protein n=1 Tax=Dyadobacter sp. SG02 TaxID=1855291 RepID=UPI0008B9D51E|nr:DUF72 domain-containing protein [Dyadobacter sp. SG02]SEJ38851.1 Uncharacterized conserved protein YecE, DUF72 family [Dyadobacter sp. SG02]